MEDQAHPLEAHDRYPLATLVDALTTDEPAQILGADGPLLASVLADLGRRLGRTLLLITEDDARARDLARDMTLFLQDSADDAHAAHHLRTQEIVHYPEYDVGPYHQASPDRKLTMRRLGILHRLHSASPPAVLVASVAAIARRTLPPEAMAKHTHTFCVEDEVDNDSLRALLVHCGFTEVPVVEDRGTFAIRGDIVDIFSPVDPYPVRMERWGDEVAEIRAFHPETQRTVEHLSGCTVFPVRQEILDSDSVRLAQKRLHERGAELRLPTAAINNQMADLRAGLHFIGIDAFLPALHERLATLLDYLRDDALPVFVRPNTALARLQELVDKRSDELDAVDEELFFPVDTYYLSPRELLAFGKSRQRVEARAVAVAPDADELAFPLPSQARSFSFRARENSDVVALRKSLQGPEQTLRAIAELIEDSWRHDYGRICFACRTPAQVERMVRMLQTLGIDAMGLPTPIDTTEPIPPPAQVVEVYHAPMSTGFRSTLLGLALITGAEVFGRRVTTRTDGGARQFAEQTAISHFRDLERGDHVVHVDFGIGRYLGLVHMEVDGIGNDFLQLEYADQDKLYLPVYRLGRVQKYIGASDHIRLDKLGGNGWERTKERVKENIREIAGELLALYARREMARGITYSAPDDMYHAFEEKFPFEETPDQARAIEETLRDMTSPRPMDRLICGDVGFGKTEVAIRAAMKAVLDARQVAVLVPTTILAEQHLLSFTKRMEDFGVHVACLSRFRSTKESKEIIKATKEGKIDVLIGTHRLLGKEVEFANLGLL
ncbi:MAG: CarD family transcriptional regulator, partial [Myxococcota bacterium]